MQHPAIGHIERVLADSYRREIDHEEDVWRSLPFFATTLALENTALFQILARLPPGGTVSGMLSIALMVIIGAVMIAALVLLTRCFAPARFCYIASDAQLLRYAGALVAAERQAAADGTELAENAASELGMTLARQYAAATEHNRGINRERDVLRAQATLAVAFSVLLIMLLIAVNVVYHTLIS